MDKLLPVAWVFVAQGHAPRVENLGAPRVTVFVLVIGDLEVVDDGRHDQGECPYPDSAVRVIFRVEGDDLIRPLQGL